MLPAAARRRLGAQLLHISSAPPAPAPAAASQALTKSSSALPQALAVNRGEVAFGPRLGLMRPSNHLLDDPAAMWCAPLAGRGYRGAPKGVLPGSARAGRNPRSIRGGSWASGWYHRISMASVCK